MSGTNIASNENSAIIIRDTARKQLTRTSLSMLLNYYV